jgi:hypothetical protein
LNCLLAFKVKPIRLIYFAEVCSPKNSCFHKGAKAHVHPLSRKDPPRFADSSVLLVDDIDP